MQIGNNQELQAKALEVAENKSFWLWWKRLAAVVAIINFGLVLFNLSYVPLRDIYLREIPIVVHYYDPIKNIEPHPDTEQYLDTVDALTTQLATNEPSEPSEPSELRSPQIINLLSDLRQQSQSLLDRNPFIVANKFGTFARLRRIMQAQMGTNSAAEAFKQFWSPTYLEEAGISQALAFFDAKVRPLLAINYYRSIDINGDFIDNFWRIDIFFVVFFGAEFLLRTFIRSLRKPTVSWWDAILRRWYDLIMITPIWRWLRIIPVVAKLHQSRLINLERIMAQVTYEPAAYLADRVSQFLLVRLVDQVQDSVNQGEVARMLLQDGSYIQVSNIDKIEAISDRLLQLTIYKVVPQIQPELKSFLRHSLEESFKQFEFYEGLKNLPLIGMLPQGATDQLADYLSQSIGDVMALSYADEEGRELLDRLTEQVKQVLRTELQDVATQKELQNLLSDLLEELKINYFKQSSKIDPEAIMTEVDRMNQAMEEGETEDLGAGDR
ncbi:hypothetical protein Pse7367_1266 [Thalassoporum mexicanum PCC 7367]|uniref:hypothetical protein n=1 Tax=Thalassoporum mexicanum TaxID=3457544 RepID=UPI00029FC973|nr:hypothetical protein [Pseudanabaena sp. PCC 7367]AFY69560.1 hypothetical protein Pse7367_1266 [Pseudanabaena sp. PCC 7367]